MSQPCRSYPNQASEDGGLRVFANVHRCGSVRLNTPGKAAISTNTTISNAETITTGFLRRSSQASRPSERARSPASGSAATAVSPGSLITDPRVDDRVEQVDQQAGEQEHDDQDAD